MKRAKQQKLLSLQLGFGLIELMVALVIGLISTLAIFQTFAASEERKRTTTSGSEGLQSSLFALGYLERLVVNSGYGLTGISDPEHTSMTRQVNLAMGQFTLSNPQAPAPELHLGCSATIAGVNRRIAPVIVTTGGAGLASDTITVFSANTLTLPLPVATNPIAVPAGATNIAVASSYGFNVGDWLLVYDQNLGGIPGTARPVPCSLTQVAALPSPGVFVDAPVNLTIPITAALTVGSVFNLGPNPTYAQLAIDANARLTSTDLLTAGATPQIIAENVLAMKLQVGVDVGGDDVIDAWINPPANEPTWTNPANPLPNYMSSTLPVVVAAPALHQAKSLRIGLLVRSPQFERTDTAGNCVTSGAGPFEILPARADSAVARLPDMPGSGTYTLAGDQRCFRYNTVTSIVPLRNQLLSEM
jgi:type IV pilus assembly protein PilW